MIKSPLIFLLVLWIGSAVCAQDTVRHIQVPGKIIGNDTVPVVDLQAVLVIPGGEMMPNYILLRYDRLVYNIRKVYPYAKLAGEKIREYNDTLAKIPTERARKKFIKQAEKELEDQFGDQIKDLTFSQGKILIKLVYRETGSSSYDLVKQLRGGFTAFVWQTMARLFGYDLKTPYDPEGEDQAIERVVLMIEAGEL
ncbi:MAG TPA: DUF4294 domain-containing protein [Bacteroidales bacterium]|nr:DUF4294 domain-containing protein [Bacteroidales bacterium]